jgi:hypothetical protein
MANHLPVTLKLKKVGKELVMLSDIDSTKLQMFLKSMPEGEIIQVTYETIGQGGSYAQLSKIHKCVRELAIFTGESFEDMKLQVKMRAGLCVDGDCKSFADCTADELSLAIQAAISIGDFVGFSLH